MMKIILKAEVDNLGLPGDIVTVANGYGRNYLIPRGMAIIATKGAEREAQALLKARRVREAATLGDAQTMKAELESRTMIIGARVDERGTLYGSVGAADVEKVLRERGHRIPRKRIDLKALKEIGEYEVEVQVHPQVSATITVEVVDETGEVTLESLAAPTPEELERAALDAASEGEGGEAVEGEADAETSDVEALAEQALEAARAFEASQEEADEATDEAAEDDADAVEA